MKNSVYSSDNKTYYISGSQLEKELKCFVVLYVGNNGCHKWE